MNELLLEAQHVSVAFGDRTLFTLARLTIAAGDRIGLVGANGCGKSTLMQLLAGVRAPDSGAVQRHCVPDYAPQFGLGEGRVDDAVSSRFGVRRLRAEEGCSGGELARLRLSRVRFGGPLLMLDEPTANLDAAGQALFAEKLAQQETFLLISHDRALLDQVCNHIWYLSKGTVQVYNGNYTAFEAARTREETAQRHAREAYLAEKRRLTESVRSLQQDSESVRTTPKRMGNSEARLHKMGGQGARKRLDQRRKSVETRLEKLEVVERVQALPAMQLDFSLTDPPRARSVVQLRDVRYAYPGGRTVLQDVRATLLNGEKTALLGANGCGKTTLLTQLAADAPGVVRSPQARIGFLQQDLSCLDGSATVLANARRHCVQREDVLRTVLTRMLLPRETWEQPAQRLSGGEKLKLCLCQLILSDCNVLVLDEPTNYLDLPSLQALETVLREYPGTVLLVSHDAAFVRHVATQLWLMDAGKVTEFPGTLTQWEEAQQQAAHPEETALRRSALQMRMTELIGRISIAPTKEKEALEAEYAACLAEYRKL